MINQKIISKYSSRGMVLEDDINKTNEYYLKSNIAAIYKKPTPITITKVDYKNKPCAKILEAYFKTPSTTDYNGIYKGKYIDFEAKETKLKYFPLNNIHVHQIKHLETVSNMGGISFVIIKFCLYDEVFLLTTKQLLDFINNNKKSIPYNYFKEESVRINYKYNPRLDYLEVINKMEAIYEKV